MTIFSSPTIHALTKRPSAFFLKLAGWTVDGDLPQVNTVGVIYPHTSNWDFPIGLATAFALQVNVRWVGKNTLFRFPFGGLMRWLGGISVDRASPQGVVDQVAAAFDGNENLIIGVTPEGTRSYVDKWKTGFHRIAKEANVPIWLCAFDYEKKRIVFGPTMMASDDMDADLSIIYDFFRDYGGKRPENAGGIPPKRL